MVKNGLFHSVQSDHVPVQGHTLSVSFATDQSHHPSGFAKIQSVSQQAADWYLIQRSCDLHHVLDVVIYRI